jgi:hypothetical protein
MSTFGRQMFGRQTFGRTDVWPTDIWPNGHLSERTNKCYLIYLKKNLVFNLRYPKISVRPNVRRPNIRLRYNNIIIILWSHFSFLFRSYFSWL